MMDILETYRRRIEELDFTPLTDEQVAEARINHADAVASARIEGLDLTPQDAAFSDLLLEMRVPRAVAMPLVLQYAKDVLAHQKLAA